MPGDSLKRLIHAYDLQRNTPRQMEVTERANTTKHVCLACRRVPDEAGMRLAWYRAHKFPGGYLPEHWPGLGGICPVCGGRLVEVTW